MIDIILRWLLCLSTVMLGLGASNIFGIRPGWQLAAYLIFGVGVVFVGSAARSYVKVFIDEVL